MFQLIKIQETIAEKEMPCDAVKGFFDYMRNAPPEIRSKQIVGLFTVRKATIRPNEK